MASAIPRCGVTSHAPPTVTIMMVSPCSSKNDRVIDGNSVATFAPSRSATVSISDSSGTATTSVALLPSEANAEADVFTAISRGDILLHHPYESFSTSVQAFIEAAAHDPQVLAIKQTLYRTSGDSPIVEALIDAAEAGKAVLALVEIKARFDEAANIQLATRLQEAGAHVMYGVVGYKTHSKMTLVVRREKGRLRRYVHLGTGNYHPRTARAYTDYGLLSANELLGEDVHQVFMQLTSLMKTRELKLLSQSPFNLHERLLGLIRRETRLAASGQRGRIVANGCCASATGTVWN